MNEKGTDNSAENRREERLSVESLSLPFLGTRLADFQAFQYIILDTSESGAGIVIPQWVMARERVNHGERVGLNLPFKMNRHLYNQGSVAWERWDGDIQGQKLGIHLDKTVPTYYPVHIDLGSGDLQVSLDTFKSDGDLLIRVIKDAFILKKGVKIYYSHLLPYFSRVAGVSKGEFEELKELFLSDVANRLETNLTGLEEIYRNAASLDLSGGRAAAFLDLEQLRTFVESEFYAELFASAFPGEMVNQYIDAIKILEQRLFYNYNTAVMLYMRSVNLG